MDIKDLIEQIVEITPPESMPSFLFTLEDTNAKHHEDTVYCYGNKIAKCYYDGISTKTMVFSVDDAVAFLHDCDIHLWELVSYEVDAPISPTYNKFREWRINLKR